MAQTADPSQPQAGNHIHIRPCRNPLPATARVFAHFGLPTATLHTKVQACVTAAAEKVSTCCLFCCGVADEMLTCHFILCILFEGDASPGSDIDGLCLISRKMVCLALVSDMWPCALDVCRTFVHNIFKKQCIIFQCFTSLPLRHHVLVPLARRLPPWYFQFQTIPRWGPVPVIPGKQYSHPGWRQRLKCSPGTVPFI